jgi:hypothetical protein
MNNVNVNATIRTLDDSEIDLIAGGVIEGGCIRMPSVLKGDKMPSNPGWFGLTWITVGQTGTVPA